MKTQGKLFSAAETSGDWGETKSIDLGLDSYRGKTFHFNPLMRNRLIDGAIGPYQMRYLLRVLGIFTSKNLPKPGTIWYSHFTKHPQKDSKSVGGDRFNSANICISGQGILDLRRAIADLRADGGTI
jgi:hypothetical protein